MFPLCLFSIFWLFALDCFLMWVFQWSLTVSLKQLSSRTCMISVNTFHAATIRDKTSTRRIHWPRGTGPKIPANQVFCSSSSSRSANQKNVVGYQAAPVTNACHMTVTPMETVIRNKNCSWIWKEERPSVPTLFWYKMPPTLFQKLFNKRNAFSSPPPRCSKEDPAFR